MFFQTHTTNVLNFLRLPTQFFSVTWWRTEKFQMSIQGNGTSLCLYVYEVPEVSGIHNLIYTWDDFIQLMQGLVWS